MPYIAILQGKNKSDAELEAYRYGSVQATEIDEPAHPAGARIRAWFTERQYDAQCQADRLASGWFGAQVCADKGALNALIATWRL